MGRRSSAGQEQQGHKSKAYLTALDEGDGDGPDGVWFEEDEQPSETTGEDCGENEVWFAEACAALLEQPSDEAVLANFQEAKKAFCKDARRALDLNRISRGFYPRAKGKAKGSDRNKGELKGGKFCGRCVRCGKVGHKAASCPQGPKREEVQEGLGDRPCLHKLDINATWPTREFFDGIFASQSPEAMKAIMDCGASESIVGALTLQRMCDELEELGFDAQSEVAFDTKFRKSFTFGNNQTNLGHARVTTGIHGQERPCRCMRWKGQLRCFFPVDGCMSRRPSSTAALLPRISSE